MPAASRADNIPLLCNILEDNVLEWDFSEKNPENYLALPLV